MDSVFLFVQVLYYLTFKCLPIWFVVQRYEARLSIQRTGILTEDLRDFQSLHFKFWENTLKQIVCPVETASRNENKCINWPMHLSYVPAPATQSSTNMATHPPACRSVLITKCPSFFIRIYPPVWLSTYLSQPIIHNFHVYPLTCTLNYAQIKKSCGFDPLLNETATRLS